MRIWIKALPLLALVFPVAVPAAGLEAWRDSYVSLDSYAGESRMEFRFSFKYRLLDLKVAPHFAFQSLYDFSYGSRYSTPVTPRQMNPGFLFDFAGLGLPLHLGYFHESNGQEIGDPWDSDGKARAKADLAARRASLAAYGDPPEWALDYVSRSWDYGHVSYRWQGSFSERWHWALEPEGRLYTGKQNGVLPTEEAIWWDPAAPPSYINQYDGLRLRATLQWRNAKLGTDLRTGYNGLGERVSLGADLELRFGRLPFFAYYFAGYGPYISDYTGYHRSSGVGFRVPLDPGT